MILLAATIIVAALLLVALEREWKRLERVRHRRAFAASDEFRRVAEAFRRQQIIYGQAMLPAARQAAEALRRFGARMEEVARSTEVGS